jgi:leader peptidase (prepilin peptidase)/N-methyltransferase
MDGRVFEGLVLAAFLAVAAIVDYRTGFIFDSGLIQLLGGLVAGGAPLLAIRILSHEGLGGGDVKLAAAGGLWLGWQHAFLALALASWIGGLAAIVLLLSGKKRGGDEVAFGPFLSLGIWISFLFGNHLIKLYGAFFCG